MDSLTVHRAVERSLYFAFALAVAVVFLACHPAGICFCPCRCLFFRPDQQSTGCPIHRSLIAMSGNVILFPASSCRCSCFSLVTQRWICFWAPFGRERTASAREKNPKQQRGFSPGPSLHSPQSDLRACLTTISRDRTETYAPPPQNPQQKPMSSPKPPKPDKLNHIHVAQQFHSTRYT
jgi:hypothetical protein